jgi:hypothetical protein
VTNNCRDQPPDHHDPYYKKRPAPRKPVPPSLPSLRLKEPQATPAPLAPRERLNP